MNITGEFESVLATAIGWNIRLHLTNGQEVEYQLRDTGVLLEGGIDHGLKVRLFLGDEDEPKGELACYSYDEIKELEIY